MKSSVAILDSFVGSTACDVGSVIGVTHTRFLNKCGVRKERRLHHSSTKACPATREVFSNHNGEATRRLVQGSFASHNSTQGSSYWIG